MYAFFNTSNPAQQGITQFAGWQYVRDGLRRNVGTVLQYYRKHPMAVPSSHFLVRLLQSITIPQSQNLQRYYDNVDALALNVAMALKMTSSLYKGEIFKGVFYGEGSSEILLAHTDVFDITQAHREWERLVPVKVLRHPRSDLGLNLPDGTVTGTETGLAVIAVNIPMLAIQYRAFRYQEIALLGESETQRSLMQFIHMYVLPNMLGSHLDLALFNRLDNLQKGAPLGASTKRHSFALPDYDSKVTKIQHDVLKHFVSHHCDFITALRTIPTAIKPSMVEVLRVPDVPPTRQVDWALSVARMQHLLFLYRVAKNGASSRDRVQVNKILRNILAYKTNNTLREMLPLELYYEVEDEIQAIADLS